MRGAYPSEYTSYTQSLSAFPDVQIFVRGASTQSIDL